MLVVSKTVVRANIRPNQPQYGTTVTAINLTVKSGDNSYSKRVRRSETHEDAFLRLLRETQVGKRASGFVIDFLKLGQ